MTQKMLIVWLVIVLVVGGVLGFALRKPLEGVLNLNAQQAVGVKSDSYNLMVSCMRIRHVIWPPSEGGTTDDEWLKREVDCKKVLFQAWNLNLDMSKWKTQNFVDFDTCWAKTGYSTDGVEACFKKIDDGIK